MGDNVQMNRIVSRGWERFFAEENRSSAKLCYEAIRWVSPFFPFTIRWVSPYFPFTIRWVSPYFALFPFFRFRFSAWSTDFLLMLNSKLSSDCPRGATRAKTIFCERSWKHSK